MVEVACAAIVLNDALKLTNFYPTMRLFYDDIITFCQVNNLSVAEISSFLSLCLGFIIFDIFSCIVEEDVTDVFFYLMFCLVFGLFLFLTISVDVQYHYMISSTSAGDLSTRVIIFDIINNFLCVLRIFFC
jgi:hypothetical protein